MNFVLGNRNRVDTEISIPQVNENNDYFIVSGLYFLLAHKKVLGCNALPLFDQINVLKPGGLRACFEGFPFAIIQVCLHRNKQKIGVDRVILVYRFYFGHERNHYLLWLQFGRVFVLLYLKQDSAVRHTIFYRRVLHLLL